MRDDTDPTTKKATKPGFDDGNCKFYYALITKAEKEKRIPMGKHHEGNESLPEKMLPCPHNEAW